MSSRNIKLILAYDGTDFLGWQKQKSGRTVQGVLLDALERMKDPPIRLNAAGRTDSGVHATGQVVNFHTDRDNIPLNKYCDALNSYLPEDVRAFHCEEVEPQFSARRSAKKRVYTYNLYPPSIGFPHLRRYCLKLRRTPDINLLNRIASVLVGEHDFTTFCAAGDENENKIRHVTCSCFYSKGTFIVFRIDANSFLRRMVRSIVGTVLELEKERRSPSDMTDILEARNRKMAGQTAPSRGLFLSKVIYHEIGYQLRTAVR